MTLTQEIPKHVLAYWKLKEAQNCPPPQFREERFRSRRTRFLYRVRKRMRELWVVMSDRERQMADPRPVPPRKSRIPMGFDLDNQASQPPPYGERLEIGFAWLNG